MEINQIISSLRNLEEEKFMRIMNLCDSPIEKKFIANVYYFFVKNSFETKMILLKESEELESVDGYLKSIFYMTNDAGIKVQVISPGNEYSTPYSDFVTLLIGFKVRCFNIVYEFFPQYPIFDHEQTRYADFVVVAKNEKDHSIIKKFIVECDGHEYHHTPEQRSRDNERTRFLNGQGYVVVRYTGSEINWLNDDFILDFENMMHKNIYGRNSPLYERVKF